MSGSATLPLKLCVVLDAAEMRIQATGGIPHDEFWRQVDAEYDDASAGSQVASGENDLHYQYLVTRPEKGRKQAYLKGRNLTVGQLIYTMRANHLSAEEAAADLNLPVEQVREAQAYYQVHRELVEADAEEEKRLLLAQGVQIEPSSVSR